MNKLINCFLLFVIAISISCKKSPDFSSPTNNNGLSEPLKVNIDSLKNLRIKFHHLAGTQNIISGTDYKNETGETFNVSDLRYYIGNIVLTKTNNKIIILANKYFLINAFEKDSIILSNIPSGNYKSISFMLGVDSSISKGPAQSGDLDPANGLYWPEMGYTYFVMKGSYKSSSTIKSYGYEVKGYNPPQFYAIQKIEKPLTQDLELNTDKRIGCTVDILEIFKNPKTWSISAIPEISDKGKPSFDLSNNYKDMFSDFKQE